jgi:hypothetical protein
MRRWELQEDLYRSIQEARIDMQATNALVETTR